MPSRAEITPHRAGNAPARPGDSNRTGAAASAAAARAVLLATLADGAWHDNEALAEAIGEERARMRKRLAVLARMGLALLYDGEKGIRLRRPLELLGADRIRSRLGADVLRRTDRLEVFTELGSTNAHLLKAPAPAPGNLTAALAEFQHAGRGRWGRTWNMPPCSGIGLSVGWSFAEAPGDLPALSLAAGVTARRAINAASGRAPGIKWPNDLVWDNRKLGGILVETASRPRGSRHVVVGLGLNVSVDSETLWTVGERPGSAIDLDTMTAGRPPSRNDMAALLIEGFFEMFGTFEKSGFAAYHDAFGQADYLKGRPVTVTGGPDSLSGTAEGVDSGGALILKTGGGPRRIVAGNVTVRPGR